MNTIIIIASHLDRVTNIDDFFEVMPKFCNNLISKISDGVHISNDTNTVKKEYKIGDEGPGGGIIFYVSKESFRVYDGMGGDTVCHYLEMSKDTLGVSRWHPRNVTIGTQTGLGYGKSNTYKILNGGGLLTKRNCAAYRASKYSTKTTKAGEWFCPARMN